MKRTRKTLHELTFNKRMLQNFHIFWQAYPRKVGKRACQRIWERVYSTLPTVDILVDILAKQSEEYGWDQSDNRKFIPHPTTWLNQGRWEDELDPQTTCEFTLSKRASVNIGSQRRW